MRSGFFVATAMLLVSGLAEARTWRVELDGSGDFTDIQPAVEASSAGDTILIGPGRFDTFHPCVAPAWTEETVVWVIRDNLTFIGSGQGVTIIGPTSYYQPPNRDPKGICSIDGYRGTIKSLTIENIFNSFYWWRGSFTMEDCRLSGSDESFVGMGIWPYGAIIRNCVIDTHTAGIGCLIGMASRDVLFENCQFLGYGYGLSIQDSTQNVRLVGCRFYRSVNGLWCDQRSTATATDCSFESIQAAAVTSRSESQVSLDRVTIAGAGYGLVASGGGVLVGANVDIEGARVAAVSACCNAFITIHDSHIIRGTGYAVKCLGTWAHTQFPDLTGNYWGTTDVDEIRASIWDASDTSETNCVVNFEPFSGVPLPTETTTWGDLKASFR